jgi:hypothetical protein
MQNITTVAELKNAIQSLEVEQDINGQLLKEHFFIVYESFKPLNLLKSTLKDISSKPLISNILGTVLGMASGYATNKIVVSSSVNIFRKLFGSVLQLGVSNAVTQHSDTIRSIGQYIFQHIFHKKGKNSETP